MTGLKLKFHQIDQEQLEQFIDDDYQDLFNLCQYPALGKTSQEGNSVKQNQFEINMSFFNRIHSIGISIDPIPYTSNLTEQTINIGRETLISVLQKIAQDDIVLTIKDGCPLIISLIDDPISIFISPNVEVDEQ